MTTLTNLITMDPSNSKNLAPIQARILRSLAKQPYPSHGNPIGKHNYLCVTHSATQTVTQPYQDYRTWQIKH